ncbi:MAG TPA: diguanylate cyclase [Acetobacteraceae bacterium]|jgi:7,8-dihydroneopterin aldolase/epimerase/oxygenase|nr:diguanylate cyclase [Acetobacteraceae bacterium]
MTVPTIANAEAGIRHVFVRDMVLTASIGIYPHEHESRQRVRINIDLGIADETGQAGVPVGPDEISRVVDYEKIANRARSIVVTGHTRLVETLAERIAASCLANVRVLSARVRVEKLDIFADAVSAGVEIERRR